MGLTEPEVPNSGVWNEAERETQVGEAQKLDREEAFKPEPKWMDEREMGGKTGWLAR